MMNRPIHPIVMFRACRVLIQYSPLILFITLLNFCTLFPTFKSPIILSWSTFCVLMPTFMLINLKSLSFMQTCYTRIMHLLIENQLLDWLDLNICRMNKMSQDIRTRIWRTPNLTLRRFNCCLTWVGGGCATKHLIGSHRAGRTPVLLTLGLWWCCCC